MELQDNQFPEILTEYLEIEDKISDEQARIMDSLFNKLHDYKCIHTNIYFDDTYREGFKFEKKKKIDSQKIKKENLGEILQKISNSLDDEKTENINYYKSLVSLINNINYIEADEQRMLYNLFFKITELKRNLKSTDETEKQFVVVK